MIRNDQSNKFLIENIFSNNTIYTYFREILVKLIQNWPSGIWVYSCHGNQNKKGDMDF